MENTQKANSQDLCHFIIILIPIVVYFYCTFSHVCASLCVKLCC